MQIAIDFALPSTEKNKTSSEIFEHANLTYGAAKEAVLCTAATNVILNFSGDDRNKTAKNLVSTKGSSFPKGFLTALKEYADKAPGLVLPAKVKVKH